MYDKLGFMMCKTIQLPLKQINITTYFENLTIGLHIFYVFDINVKFYVN